MDSFLESYRVDSPEHVELEFSLAGLGTRTVAYILDLLIRIVIGLVFLLAISLLDLGPTLFHMSELMIVVAVIFVFFLQWAYFVILELKMNGQTPGKRIMKIRVVRDGGYPLTFFSSAIRNLLRIVDFLPGLYGLGVFLIFVSERKKRLGDYLAGTIVIHQQQVSLMSPAAAGTIRVKRFPLLRLSHEEKHVIRTFLERADSLEREARVRVREKIYQNMAERIRQLYPQFQEEPPYAREALLRELIQDE